MQAGIEAINRDVMKSFANLKLGMDILKQVLTQLLLHSHTVTASCSRAWARSEPLRHLRSRCPRSITRGSRRCASGWRSACAAALPDSRSVIAAAGDTFRAGAIQQLESHCERLGIRCVSSQRGGDSAAIARDAIDSAKAKGIDVVLVDTAGRMQNKTNLMNELNKVRKVTNPHLTLFVGAFGTGIMLTVIISAFQGMTRPK